MPPMLLIQDGNPIWLSDSIVPSKDTVGSPSSSPAFATIHESSADVFVYVKVENIGGIDLGAVCTCTGTGLWTSPSINGFPGCFANPNNGTSETARHQFPGD